MATEEEVRLALEQAIVRAQEAHRSGEVLNIFNDEAVEGLVFEYEGPFDDDFALALEFLSGWADSAEHDWKHYPVQEAEWIPLSEVLLNELRNGGGVRDKRLLEHFRLQPSEGLWGLSPKQLLVGAASFFWLFYCVAFTAWLVPHMRRTQAAIASQDLEALPGPPSPWLFGFHALATIGAFVLLITLLRHLWNSSNLTQLSKVAWTAFLVLVAPLGMPAYFWNVYRLKTKQEAPKRLTPF